MCLRVPVQRLAIGSMTGWRRIFFASRKRLWPVAIGLAALDAGGIYLLLSTAPEPARAALPKVTVAPKAPEPPPPPAMIDPPPVARVLQSGTLIVISKPSQAMFVFSDGQPWGSAPVSTGKRGHATPSGVFPVLHKRRHHRSNIYSNAPMPFMQRLTWEGIALHAGRVPGYPASHGCVRLPPGFAEALFRLTDTEATTVVIGDAPLASEAEAQHFALTAALPVRAQLAPPLDPKVVALADSAGALARAMFAGGTLPVPPASVSLPPAPPAPEAPAAALAASPRAASGPTIQLAAAPSQAEAEAHWASLLRSRPELSRFEKTVEAATVNARPVFRLRISGVEAHGVCAKLKSEGIGCFEVS